MKYWLTYAVDTRYRCCVDAESLDKAIEKGEELFENADIGELEFVDMEFDHAEDENGDCI